MILYLIPVFILGFLLLVMVTMAILSRYKGGKYLRPVFQFLTKIPILKGLIQKASEKAIARYNPELAGAMKKLQRAGADKDPMRAQQALSTLSADERKALNEFVARFPDSVNVDRAKQRLAAIGP